jgi:hypothetical protein
VTINDILSAIEAREKDATPGPWVQDIDEHTYARYVVHGERIIVSESATSPSKQTGLIADWEFIAHARTDVPRLVKALRQAMDAIDYWGLKTCRFEIESILNGSEQ